MSMCMQCMLSVSEAGTILLNTLSEARLKFLVKN